MTDLSARHVGTVFRADAIVDPDGIAVRRCPACGTGIATFLEDRTRTLVGCSNGCAPSQILAALPRPPKED